MDDREGVDVTNHTHLYEVDGTSGCWLWLGARHSHGYGTVGRPTQLAHRWMYQQIRGPIPQGYDLDHLCRTPQCVNPAHLEPVLPSVNCQRGAKAKVTPADVEQMRHLAATTRMTQADIGKRYGIHSSHVSRILSGRRWPMDPTGRRAT